LLQISQYGIIDFVTMLESSTVISFYQIECTAKLCLHKTEEKDERKHTSLIEYIPNLFFIQIHLNGVPIQVLFWAKEEDRMEKLKARLIELYYENLFKVISSDILSKIVVKCVTRSL
jgi:hypothetical protein